MITYMLMEVFIVFPIKYFEKYSSDALGMYRP